MLPPSSPRGYSVWEAWHALVCSIHAADPVQVLYLGPSLPESISALYFCLPVKLRRDLSLSLCSGITVSHPCVFARVLCDVAFGCWGGVVLGDGSSESAQQLSSCLRPNITQETEGHKAWKECEALQEQVKTQTCESLETELHDVLQEKKRLSLTLFTNSQRAAQYEQVKSHYDQLREHLVAVTQERDSALQEKIHLQGKLENLEQVLTHMREAAERRQHLEVEHDQALAVLNAKQQEIDLLQKAQVEAKREHEGAVHLLENHLDSMQAKVRELEEKCRSQSEQFNLLSRELEKFRLQAGTFDILSTDPLSVCESPGSPNKSLSQLLNGLATPVGKGNESLASRSVISEFIRPLQISGDRPELLSIKPAFLTRSPASSPRRPFLSEMDSELGSTPRSKARYTGKVRLCIARYSYNPYDGPNENPEAELPLVAGKYLYVYGVMDEDGFYEGELLDGQRGLVPSNFVDFVQDEELPPSQPGDVSKESGFLHPSGVGGVGGLGGLGSLLGPCSNGMGTLDVSIDEIGEDIVPYPRRITLIKQLAKSVIVGWDPPVVPPGWGSVSGYNVLVDQELRATVPAGGRTKALLEKLSLASGAHRVSVQSLTERGPSDPLRCTLLVGRDVVVAPYYLRVDHITQNSAELSWMPSNSNYSHTIFLNDSEYDAVKAGGYKYRFCSLKPASVYKVKAVAQPHQMPWQLPLEHREKREISVEFCTQPAGPPFPPQEVQVQCGQVPGVLQVRWKPPTLTPTGTSNGASVIGYAVCTKGQRIAEVMYPTADYVMVELTRIQCLEAREVIVKTLSAQGESQDSSVATIPHNLLPKPSLSAREAETKEPEGGLSQHGLRVISQPWDPSRAPSPLPPSHGHALEPPAPPGHRSPSPQRILPQPQGAPIPHTVAKAIAREAAQRVAAETSRMEKRNIFSERSNAMHSLNSDDEEEGYESPYARRRGASVDEFLRGSELGRQSHFSHSEDYQTESSRGSDLSDIMEEDEEELYSEMQLEEGRRRSINSHNTLKAYYRRGGVGEARDSWDLQREVFQQKSLRTKRLHSIPEVSEDEPDGGEVLGQRLRFEETRPGTPRARSRPPHACYPPEPRPHPHAPPGKGGRRLERQRSSPRFPDSRPVLEEHRPSRQTTKSPDSGLDCGSEEEGPQGPRAPSTPAPCGAPSSPAPCGARCTPCTARGPWSDGRWPAGARGRSRANAAWRRSSAMPRPHCGARPCAGGREGSRSPGGSQARRGRGARAVGGAQLILLGPGILGNPPSMGRSDRLDHSGRRMTHGGPPHRRPMMVPSIEITMESNSEGGNLSPIMDDVYYGSVARHRIWPLPSLASEHRYDGYSGRGRGHHSPEYYEESEPEELSRIFVALFDYDPLSMSPNPDAADEELPFREGQIIRVYGDKDTDGFYRGETEDEDMMEQLVKQGFLPLNTPVEKIERNRRSGRQHPVSTRRMVALYDYDPRESSPNVDVEAELTFCAGDIISVYGDIDEDGFYYGELNGHKGLVPSNFLEEVPDDVEVFLTDTPSPYPQDSPARTKSKRVPGESAGPPRRVASPSARPHRPGSGPAILGPGSPVRGPRDLPSKKTKGLLSKGKKLLKRLGAVK
ncbi:hypothetical protein AAFF_G00390500 [Aldrovandia affinis]|uniref:RIMS-binding protein 2 n=1 Tax=Aldrovandia affinis TaxID=143900 RepID=A0AAD7SEM3_9TELE|nr:hypothetical protein AAFF_G00390500 [Aldrovandia affinis]